MDKKTLNSIKRQARWVRKWAEKEYPKTSTLSQKCAICSWILLQRLKSFHVNAMFVINSFQFHCYVKVDDFIVDVTATQFNCEEKVFPKVMVVPQEEATFEYYDMPIWEDQFSSDDPEKIRSYLRKWPRDQQPGIV